MALLSLAADLRARAESGRPVTVGLAGAGQMGTDIVCQIRQMPGLRLGAVADVSGEIARAATTLACVPDERVRAATSASAVDEAVEAGCVAIAEGPALMARAGRIDVVIDATGNPNVGAGLTLELVRGGKHIVMMNVECDITVGRLLRAEAEAAGVVYTLAAGDEPAATMELITFARDLGMTVVAAGKGKNNPLDHDATPASCADEARRRQMNPRMLCEFVDGSKTMIEMVAVANATGLVPDRPGMHGPAATLDTLAEVLCPREDGGVLAGKGRVDYSVGKGVAPGVFCVVELGHPRLTERMVDLKVGKGPYFTLYRPYHLTSLEVPLSAARAALYGRADMAPIDRPVAEVAALAKRDLAPGETLDRIGEFGYRGWAVTAEDARAQGALPIGLAERARVTRPVRKGEPLTYANCAPDESLAVVQLRRRLDRLDAGEPTRDAA
jgi:predicted homoserine dehydrogenase-like protein